MKIHKLFLMSLPQYAIFAKWLNMRNSAPPPPPHTHTPPSSKKKISRSDGADLRMESFSCKQSPHTLSLGANGFTLLTTSHLILKLMVRSAPSFNKISEIFGHCIHRKKFLLSNLSTNEVSIADRNTKS